MKKGIFFTGNEAEALRYILRESLKDHDTRCNCAGPNGEQEKGCLLWVASARLMASELKDLEA